MQDCHRPRPMTKRCVPSARPCVLAIAPLSSLLNPENWVEWRPPTVMDLSAVAAAGQTGGSGQGQRRRLRTRRAKPLLLLRVLDLRWWESGSDGRARLPSFLP